MNWIVKLISKLGITIIPIDKQAHLLVGVVISMITFFLSGSLLAGVFMATFAGYVREYFGEVFDMKDFWFTVGGGVAFVPIGLLVMWIW